MMLKTAADGADINGDQSADGAGPAGAQPAGAAADDGGRDAMPQ